MKVKLIVKLDKILSARGLTQKELVSMLNKDLPKHEKKFRAAAVSELYTNQRSSLNKRLIERIAMVLDIKDINELIELRIEKSKLVIPVKPFY